ncbi:UNVERIFIED_CONTAM: hypothetical protein Slati_0962600 [Sesamum latifolium]|uniref:Uncharacterized protein n=1 Tax=Sesamum latifolium TaxID=2727402 RepID=A0AAW2XQM3_9LAMI
MKKQVEAHDEAEASTKQHYTEKDKSAKELQISSDGLKMPIGYQPSKFQQFDGKGNPKQHVVYFVKTCNNAGTYGDHLVKQFVRSLKGNAFDCTRPIVSMVELTNSRNGKKNQSLITSIGGGTWALIAKIDYLKLPLLRCAFKRCIGAFDIFSKESYPNPLKN